MVHCGIAAKAAFGVSARDIARAHVAPLAPVQSPPQPVKLLPALGSASSVTATPESTCVAHPAPEGTPAMISHLAPPGITVTVPAPRPDPRIVSAYLGGAATLRLSGNLTGLCAANGALTSMLPWYVPGARPLGLTV